MDNDIARLRVTMAVAGDAQNRSRRPAFRRKAEPSLGPVPDGHADENSSDMRIGDLARLLIGTALLMTGPALTIPSAPVLAQTVDPDLFYEALAEHGSWLRVEPYGEVWAPEAGAGWQPYAQGRWSYVERYGWYWESREPWAWATYHYGGWVKTAAYGWVWAPGHVWAPAWVVWRIGGGYIGWTPAVPQGAPAPPVPPSAWIFVREHDFLSADIPSVAVPVEDNARLLSQAMRSGSVRIIGDTGVNTFIDRTAVSRALGYDVTPRPLPSMAPPLGAAFAPYPPVSGPVSNRFPSRRFGPQPVEPADVASYGSPNPYDAGLPGRFQARPLPIDPNGPHFAGAPGRTRSGMTAPAGFGASKTPGSASNLPQPVETAPLPPPTRDAGPSLTAPAVQPAEPADALRAARPQNASQPAPAASTSPPPEDASKGQRACTPEQAKADADACRPVRMIR
jgi:hypothetical protein